MENQNPAKSLYTILKEANALGDPNGQAFNALEKSQEFHILGETRELTIIGFSTLLERTRKSILLLEDSEEFLEGFTKVQNLFVNYFPLTTAWSNITTEVKKGSHLQLIHACSYAIEKETDKSRVNIEVLKQLITSVEEVILEIETSQLEESLKGFLTQQLKSVCDAAKNYSHSEPEKLRQVVQATIANVVVMSADVSSEQKQDPALIKTIKTLIGIGGAINLARQAQWLVPKLVESAHSIQHFLPHS